MFSGKNEEAAAMLQEAAAMLEQGKAEEPANSRILQTEKKLEKMQKAVDKKLGTRLAMSSSSGPALPPKPQAEGTSPKTPANTGSQSAAAKLPGGVGKRLKDIARFLDSAEQYASQDAKQARYKLDLTEELFAEIDKNYADQFDPNHPDYAAAKERYNQLAGKAEEQGAAEVRAKADAANSGVAKEGQSNEWLARFRPYLSYSGQEGHNPDKLVFVPGTSEPEKFADAQRRYDELKKVYAEYQKTDFPNGKTWELEEIADNEAPNRLRDFEEGIASRVGSVVERATNDINAAMTQLEKENGWRTDKSIKPNLVDHKWMASISEATDQVLSALGADNPQAREVKAKFAALVDKDRENRRIRMERTFMTPDRYTGNDIKALKEKAKALVGNDRNEGGTPLRCTVIAENWREETVQEWTDTSRSQMRWRTTRHQTAQVAAKNTDSVRLITVALAQEKQGDGNWGPLYGNLLQGFDPMLEANVDNNRP